MKAHLNPTDLVGVSFWIISAAMLAATFFFWVERDRAKNSWKTSLSVAAMVTGIAALHYFYMREFWLIKGESPIVLRYVDWILTVPLQIVEFYLILCAVSKVRPLLFWKLLLSSLVMLIAGYLGEIKSMNIWLAFLIGMAGWLYILYEIFIGEASQINKDGGTKASKKAFHYLRLIVTIGWAIYPIGYVMGYMGNGFALSIEGQKQVSFWGTNSINIIYNLADFINKIAFGVVIWAAASSEE